MVRKIRRNSCKPMKRAAPTRAVFVAYVDFGAAAIESARRQLDRDIPQFGGVTHYWEWVLASEENPRLPDGCGRRYTERVWGS